MLLEQLISDVEHKGQDAAQLQNHVHGPLTTRAWRAAWESVARRVGLDASARGALGRDAVKTYAKTMRRCVQFLVVLLLARLADYAHALPTM